MRSRSLIAVLLLLLASSPTYSTSAAATDVVIPSDRVTVGVNVRAAPNATSEVLAVLRPGAASIRPSATSSEP